MSEETKQGGQAAQTAQHGQHKPGQSGPEPAKAPQGQPAQGQSAPKSEQDKGKGTKQEQQAAEAKPAAGKAEKEKKAPEPKKVAVATFSVKGEPKENDKCPPQAKVVLDAVKEAAAKHGGRVTRDQVVEALSAPGKLKTVQEPGRIFSFYRPRLKEMGVLVEHSEERTEEPAKAARTTGQ